MEIRNPNWIHISLDENTNQYISLMHIGREKCNPGYSYTNYRDIYLIHYIKSGCGKVYINDKEYSLKENDAFIIRPRQLVSYTADSESPWEYYYFAFSGIYASEIVEKTVFSKNTLLYTFPESAKVDKAFIKAIDSISSSENISFCSLENLFFLLQLFNNEKTDKTATKTSITYQKYVATTEQFIQTHYNDKNSVLDFVKNADIEKSYFYRIFKENTGMSVEKYLLNFRVQQAKLLLSDTNLDLAQIASQVGYTNYVSFYKLFKKIVGKSPEEYRKSPTKT